MNFPGAIIFCNDSINDILKDKLKSQLQLNEIITFSEFVSRMTSDPNYGNIVRNSFLRILVLLTNFQDQNYREQADIVLYCKQGLASIELNNIGPYGLSIAYDNLYLHKLLRYNDKIH